MSLLDDIEMAEVLDHEGVDYKLASGSSGEQLNIKECPFCGKSKWKVYANADTGLGNCFSCGQTFNKWVLLCAILGTEDRTLLKRKIAEIGKALGFKPAAKKLEVLVEAPSALLPLSLALPDSNGKNSPYLEKRGITGHYAKRFSLRWCRHGYHEYVADGQKKTQYFNDRIIIPIFDLEGQLVTFQGRDITGESDRKYLFPAQLPATGRYLYNGHEALARRTKHIIMNEGAFDVIPTAIACDTIPELNGVVPVGSFGKKLSSSVGDKASQVDALRALKVRGGLKTVTMMWDGEPAALSSALDACRLIQGIGVTPRIALLPAGKDPNEVDAATIARAYLNASTYSRLLEARWRTRNPYS
jgi:DNA primase